MRLSSFALSLLLLAVPTVVSAEADSDPVIDAGRLGVMMSQSAEALARLSNAAHADDTPDPALSAETQAQNLAFQQLVTAVLRYNAVSNDACRMGVAPKAVCPGPFLPPWLGGTAPHSDAALRAMIDEASGRLMPFWNAMCEEAVRSGADENFCAIE